MLNDDGVLDQLYILHTHTHLLLENILAVKIYII